MLVLHYTGGRFYIIGQARMLVQRLIKKLEAWCQALFMSPYMHILLKLTFTTVKVQFYFSFILSFSIK